MQISRTTLIAPLALTIILTAQADVVDDYAPGRSGEALKATLSRHCRPSVAIDSDIIAESLVMLQDKGGNPLDGLTGRPLHDLDFAAVTYIVPLEWMNPVPTFRKEASTDLNNMLLTDGATAIDRGQLPLGDSTDNIDCVTPPPSLKGDIARAVFYIATLYPCELWGSWGRSIFDNTAYPTLRKEWSEMYMRWHQDDPVDEQERQRDEMTRTLQGNSNPFVTHPDLADYLWGEKAGAVYKPSAKPDNPDSPDTPGGATPPGDIDETPTPLRECYDSSDTYVYLYSPYVPDNVRWTVDGAPASGRIEVASLSTGRHELRYSSPTAKGKLIITVRQ